MEGFICKGAFGIMALGLQALEVYDSGGFRNYGFGFTDLLL